MIKRYWIYVLLSLGLITFCTLWVVSENKNSTYEHYLSHVVADKAANISSLPTYTSEIVEEVLDDGTISNTQATVLTESLWELYREIQDLEGFAIQLGKLDKVDENNYAQSVIYEFYTYMINLHASMDTEKLTLTVEQESNLEKMKSQLQAYSTVITDNLSFSLGVRDHPVGFHRHYTELGITNDYWIKLLIGYEEVSKISE